MSTASGGAAGNRFRKGQSGNPKGRPKKQRATVPSAFDIVMDKRLTVANGARQRELTIDEALQVKTYQDALAGSRMARRAVLRMIEKREKAIAAKAPPGRVEVKTETADPRNADEAMKILGIATRNEAWMEQDVAERLLIEPWAVRAALSRRSRKVLRRQDIDNLRYAVRDWDKISWPEPDA